MARTLIVIDPFGFNLTSLGMQYLLLKGTLMESGDTAYRLPYTNLSGIDNIDDGVDALDTKLRSTSGEILVFAYSQGCHVAQKWLRLHGHPAPVTPTERVSFLLIGNPSRKYGGFSYRHSTFDAVADTVGLPDPLEDGTSTVHYRVTDLARQYDGVADFPGAQDIQTAIESIGGVTTDPADWMVRALQDVTNALIGTHKDAMLNALLGMALVHNNYFSVTPDDLHNVRLTSPDHPLVTYVWAPTYPVPLLGAGITLPSIDREKRLLIEAAYSRPVTLPMPNYPQISLFTTDFFGSDADFRQPDKPGWFPEGIPPRSAYVTAPAPLAIVVQAAPGTVVATGLGASVVAPGPVEITLNALPGQVVFGTVLHAPAPMPVNVESLPGQVAVSYAVTSIAPSGIEVASIAGVVRIGTTVTAPASVAVDVSALPGTVVSSQNVSVTAPAPVAIPVSAISANAKVTVVARPDNRSSGVYKQDFFNGGTESVSFSHTPTASTTISQYILAINSIDYYSEWTTPVVKVGSTALTLISTSHYDVVPGSFIGSLFIYQMDGPPQGKITFDITNVKGATLCAGVFGFVDSTTVTLGGTVVSGTQNEFGEYPGPAYPTKAQADCAFAAFAARSPIGSAGGAGGWTNTVNSPANDGISLVVTAAPKSNLDGRFSNLTFAQAGQLNNTYSATMCNIKH